MAVILTGVTVFFVILYNRLVSLQQQFRNAFAQIDVQLQRRYELIPNLVEVAATYLQHENDTLTDVTRARNNADSCRERASEDPANRSLIDALGSAEERLTASLGKLQLLVESYPDLKADGTISDLHEELASTDNRVAFSRQAFNDAVMRYNTFRQQIPAVFVAALVGFRSAEFFVVKDSRARETVSVSFDNRRRAA